VPQPARGRTGRQLGGGLVTSRCSSRRTPCVRAELHRNWSWCTAAHVVPQETTVSDLATTQSGAVLLQRQHDSSLGRLAQSSLQEQSPSYPPLLSVRASHFLHLSPTVRHPSVLAHPGDQERVTLTVKKPSGRDPVATRSAHEKSQGRGERRCIFLPLDSLTRTVPCQKGADIYVLAVVKFLSPLWPERDEGEEREGREDEEEQGQCRRHCRSSAPRSSCSSCCAARRWPMGGPYGSMRLLRSLRLSSSKAASPPQRLRHLLPRVGWRRLAVWLDRSSSFHFYGIQ
jgi:hypothetical protein